MTDSSPTPPPPVDRSGWVFESAMEFIPSPEPEYQREFEQGRSLMSARSTTTGSGGELVPVSFRNGLYTGELVRTYEMDASGDVKTVTRTIERMHVSLWHHRPWYSHDQAKERAWMNGVEAGIMADGRCVAIYYAVIGPVPSDPDPNKIYCETVEQLANRNPYELPEELKQRILAGKPVVDIPEGRMWWGPGSSDPAHIIAAARKKAEYDAMCEAHDEIEVHWLCGLAWLRGLLKGLADKKQTDEQESRKGSYT